MFTIVLAMNMAIEFHYSQVSLLRCYTMVVELVYPHKAVSKCLRNCKKAAQNLDLYHDYLFVSSAIGLLENVVALGFGFVLEQQW